MWGASRSGGQGARLRGCERRERKGRVAVDDVMCLSARPSRRFPRTRRTMFPFSFAFPSRGPRPSFIQYSTAAAAAAPYPLRSYCAAPPRRRGDDDDDAHPVPFLRREFFFFLSCMYLMCVCVRPPRTIFFPFSVFRHRSLCTVFPSSRLFPHIPTHTYTDAFTLHTNTRTQIHSRTHSHTYTLART